MVDEGKSQSFEPGAQQLRLAYHPRVERTYTADRDAMLAALRVVLGLPKAPSEWIKELS